MRPAHQSTLTVIHEYQATCKKFYEYCSKHGVAMSKRNFTLKYNTNVPRQVGLAGSSAIVTATFQCLMAFYGLTDRDIPKPMQPDFVLSVEMEVLPYEGVVAIFGCGCHRRAWLPS